MRVCGCVQLVYRIPYQRLLWPGGHRRLPLPVRRRAGRRAGLGGPSTQKVELDALPRMVLSCDCVARGIARAMAWLQPGGAGQHRPPTRAHATTPWWQPAAGSIRVQRVGVGSWRTRYVTKVRSSRRIDLFRHDRPQAICHRYNSQCMMARCLLIQLLCTCCVPWACYIFHLCTTNRWHAVA